MHCAPGYKFDLHAWYGHSSTFPGQTKEVSLLLVFSPSPATMADHEEDRTFDGSSAFRNANLRQSHLSKMKIASLGKRVRPLSTLAKLAPLAKVISQFYCPHSFRNFAPRHTVSCCMPSVRLGTAYYSIVFHWWGKIELPAVCSPRYGRSYHLKSVLNAFSSTV